MKSNFEFLSKYWPELAGIGAMAESYLYSDPNACVFKLGLLAERIVSEITVSEKLPSMDELTHADRLRLLQRENILPRNIDDILFAIRKARNDAVHTGVCALPKAQTLLRMAFNLCVWFMEVYGDWNYFPSEYIVPTDRSNEPDFDSLLRMQEERLNELADRIEDLRTTAPTAAPEERCRQAVDVSEKLELTDAETQYLIGEQVRLEVSALSVVNYALQQNRIPVIQAITIVNNSGRVLENVDIRITASPELCLQYTRHLDLVPADGRYDIKDIRLILNGEFMTGLTEKVTGLLHISLACEENLLFSDNMEITVLAFDEWQGYGFYPELLSAFVTPNHPETVKINARAADLLGGWTGDPSLDAYQTQDPDRVLKQAAAIYGALQEQNIVYAVPPASFERVGQRVRLCDAVMQQKMGTCLDLTLFYAACLESSGLHPLLIINNGHIFAGVWLDDLSFPESVQYDPSLITKRLASGISEIAVVECTLMTSGKHADFDAACRAAEREMLGENPIECIVDVNRARLSGVSPLPLRIQTESGWRAERDSVAEADITSAPQNTGKVIDIGETSKEEEFSKKTQWERKLLDLGLRNSLINMRLSKTLIPILSPTLDGLEDALSDGRDFSILSRPSDWRISEDSVGFETMHDLGINAEVIQSEFKNARLRSAYTEAELAKTIKDLYRASKAALEENGANTLYLALGLLRWYETSRSTKARYAPVVLLPIEIVRKSAAQGYVIRLRDDESQMNITVLEKIKQDFGIVVNGLDPLPQDEHGIDIRRVFTILRKGVMEQPRWDVLESAYLGIFSFSQFVMWNDIRNRSGDLARNKIVHSLMDGKLSWDAQDMQIGERVPEDHVFLPLSADASQLFAIEAASRGESFVLHGPPGTGKSQTITALIANALAQGRTVLFVAEKMAALEVVQKRLTAIGIGPFCLELHSNKSKKKDVLEQLRQATEVTNYTAAEAFESKSVQIAALRTELDEYAACLHRKLPCGFTLFELINSYERFMEAPEISPFGKTFADDATPDLLDRQKTITERLVAAAREIGHPHAHPLQAVKRTQYSQQIRAELAEKVAAYRGSIAALVSAGNAFAGAIREMEPSTFDEYGYLASLSKELTLWLELPEYWAKTDNISRLTREVGEMAQHYIASFALHDRLSESWTDGFLAQDASTLCAEYGAVSQKWFLAKMIGLNKIAKRMAAFSKKPIAKDSLGGEFSALADYQAEKTAADALFMVYQDSLGNLYTGKDSDWQRVKTYAEQAAESAKRLQDLCKTERLRIEFGANRALRSVAGDLCGAWNGLFGAKNALYSLLDISDQEGPNWAAGQLELCSAILDHADSLKEWFTWNGICKEAEQAGLQNVVQAYKSGVEHKDIVSAYIKTACRALAVAAIDASPVLNTFSGAVFNEKIEQFKRFDKEFTSLTQQEIFCRLAARVPNFAREAAQSSELGILQRAIRSGGRGISIRKLFEQIPNLLPRLCPCMLMSPISAAQYLEPNREPFDLVVFDEASQLPTCKAVGALARGTDAVIVGDPKQMPPTSFFATNTVDEDNLDVEDLESILDDCLALNMPQTHLLWHYRSRHESLIAFSNSQFYENKLYTFPSVNDLESKVSLVHVNGVFERGKSRQNRAEAQAVVAELIRRCHNAELSGFSVGVVTFNISQQNLIDDRLTEACRTDAELEKWAYESAEPIFIKNLENVQGDERDVILFSIGYGPDETGRVYMNFGPLNREGGWRRLNVAVSRARCEMIVFSTLTPDQINLSRTSAEGVAALKSFLEYANGHSLPQNENIVSSSAHHDAGVAGSICAVLKENGYETKQMVGHSGYRIDIGVIDPRQPERYLLGILLDGASYGNARTTRDREIAQLSVLNGLGWHIMRIWTMDWWDNNGKECKRILAELKRLAAMPEGKFDFGVPNHKTTAEAAPPAMEIQSQRLASSRIAVPIKAQFPEYSATTLRRRNASADDFVQPHYNSLIQDCVLTVMSHEAPISEGMLTRRVVQSFGIMRAGSRIQAHMNNIFRSMRLKSTIQDGQRFFWNNGQEPEAYAGFRVSGDDDCKRDAKDVPVQEAANAVIRVLTEQISLSQDDLIREAASLMGYTRAGSNVTALFAATIEYAASCGKIMLGINGNWKTQE